MFSSVFVIHKKSFDNENTVPSPWLVLTMILYHKNTKTAIPLYQNCGFYLAEKERFELSNRFWRLHDFQSCALDQLGDFSKYSVVALTSARGDSYIISQTKGFVNTFFYFFSLFSGNFGAAKMPQRPRWSKESKFLGDLPQPRGTFWIFTQFIGQAVKTARSSLWALCDLFDIP